MTEETRQKRLQEMEDLAAAMGVEGLSVKQRVDEWRYQIGLLNWSCEDGDCCFDDTLRSALQKAKDLDLSLRTAIGRKKGHTQTVYSLLMDMTGKCNHYPDLKERREELCDSANDVGIRVDGRPSKENVQPPEMYCEHASKAKDIWHQSADGHWQPVRQNTAKDLLNEAGLSPKRGDDGTLSEIEQHMLNVTKECGIDAAMPLAGYPTGLHEVNGQRILVNRSFKLPEPKRGDCCNIMALLDGLFGHDDDQYCCLLLHLKESYRALRAGLKSGSVAVFVCGDIDSGKSLLTECVIAPMLGGRWGSAYKYLSGETKFNDELIHSEVWTIDDGPPFADYTMRRKFGALVKNAVAAGGVACEGKGKGQFTVPLYRRLFVMLNSTDLEVMPTLDDSMRDKFMLLKACPYTPPEGCAPLPTTLERPAYAALLASEIPAFVYEILNADLSFFAERRFGVKAYKHPELMRSLSEASGVEERAIVIQKALFGSGEFTKLDAVELKASAIYEHMLESRLAARVRELFRNHRALASALGELRASVDYGKLFKTRILHGHNLWTVSNDPELVKPVRTKEDEDSEVR